MIDTGLNGKTALVTGANHGIGAATALALAAQGAKVFISYLTLENPYSGNELEEALRVGVGGDALYHAKQQQLGDAVVETVRAQGGEAAALEIDLGESENVEGLIGECESQLGPVDILIINHTHDVLETFDPARVTHERPHIEMTNAEGIDRHFAVNARAGALLMREYLHRHIQRDASWGRIVSLTTSAGHAWNISYAASKSALVSFCLSASEEMGKYGITVNVVRPGGTQTGYITPEMESQIVAQTALGRVGDPEDIADVIVFLASEQGRWITGQVVTANGGVS